MMTADDQNNHRFKIIHSFGLQVGDTALKSALTNLGQLQSIEIEG